MRKSIKKRILFGIFWVVLIVSFIFFATVLIAYANGYHVNIKNFHLQRTGMIVVDGQLKTVKIYVNTQEYVTSLPVRFSRLAPGRYDVKVTSSNYQDWEKVVNLSGGEAVNLSNVVLFLQVPQVSKSPADQSIENRANSNYLNQTAGIAVNTNELRYQDKLITRFSQTILGAIYDSNSDHFYLQLNDELRAIDIDGSNNRLLIKLSSAEPVKFYLNGNNLYYISNNELYQVKIR